MRRVCKTGCATRMQAAGPSRLAQACFGKRPAWYKLGSDDISAAAARPSPTMNSTTRRHHPITALAAVEASPTLARLAQLTRDSSNRLAAVLPLVPPMLRPSLQAGPVEGDSWCILVKNNAAAAKIRQLLPAMAAHLRTKGWNVAAIRIKVQG